MGTLSSAIAPILQIGSAVGSVAGFVQPFAGNASKNARDKAEITYLTAATNAQKAQNLLRYNAAEDARRSKLRTSLAAQRAKYGGRGLDANDASPTSVLGAITADSAQEGAYNADELALNNTALDLKLAQSRQLNLLDRQSRTQKTLLNALSDGF